MGLYNAVLPVDGERLQAAISSLAHRGPDHQDVYCDGSLGLAHTRLSIIDLAGGDQPFIDEQYGLILVANGEIYNHLELRKELEDQGRQFQTHSDCETILHAYAVYGDTFLEHIGGMFAFALFDRKKQRLILARDRLGMKPLFIAETSEGVCFASEIKALLPALAEKPSINPSALIQFLQNQNASGRETLFSGIEQLLPGECVTVEQGRVVDRLRYWSALGVEPRDISYAEAESEFDSLMETVMTQHMRADVPFGLFLSGGVDSTTLLALLSRYKAEPIRTFSLGFCNSSVGDELSTAESIAKHFNSQHTIIRPTAESMLQRLVYSTWAADDLMRDFANLPTSLLAEEAAQDLKVVFSGEGGDEAFAGYGRYRPGKLESLLKNRLYPGSGGFRTGGNFRGGLPKQLFSEKLLQRADQWRAPIITAWQEAPTEWSDLQRRQYVDITTALPDNLLVKADRMLMSWGLEGRLPFVDHRVIEFGLSLPDGLKIEGKQGKMFLKKWASRHLPSEHFWQKKRGFSVPVGDWLASDYLGKVGMALLESPAIAEWMQRRGVEKLLKRQQQKGDVTKNIYALLQFSIWHKLFIEGSGVRPPTLIDPLRFLAEP
ncbi:MAG: asparagine synthase (glutamine-hydrolyzing) [Gammaproteobacteria bacterium]|nr:asparagine synthase (glutamine-hydrolyzing) [Gammaproteobacteria bacterium]